MGGANTDADANSDANERDPSHFTAGNLTEKTGFEQRPLDLILLDGERKTRLTSYKERVMQCKLLQVRSKDFK